MEAFLRLDLRGSEGYRGGGGASPPLVTMIDRCDVVLFAAPIASAAVGAYLGIFGVLSSTAVGMQSRFGGGRRGEQNNPFHPQRRWFECGDLFCRSGFAGRRGAGVIIWLIRNDFGPEVFSL